MALAFIPIAGGTGRMAELLGGPEVLPTDARFAASPVPLVVHTPTDDTDETDADSR